MKNKLLLRTAILACLVLGHVEFSSANDLSVCPAKFDGVCSRLADPKNPCKLPDGLLDSIESDLAILRQAVNTLDTAVSFTDPEDRVPEIREYLENLESLNSDSFVKDELQRFLDVLDGKVEGEMFKGKYESINKFLTELTLKDEEGGWLDADEVNLGWDYCKPLVEGLSNCHLDFPLEEGIEKAASDYSVAYTNLYYDGDISGVNGGPTCVGSEVVRLSIIESSCCKAVLSDQCFECPEISAVISFDFPSNFSIINSPFSIFLPSIFSISKLPFNITKLRIKLLVLIPFSLSQIVIICISRHISYNFAA